jgi:hypothetical protein
MLFYVFITYTYSGGLPILYPIASIYFFFTYWIDKWLLIKYHLEPPHFNEKMALEIVAQFKYAVVLHFIVTYFMYRDPQIMELYPKVKDGLKGSHYFYICLVLVIIMFLWRTCVKPCRNCFTNFNKSVAEIKGLEEGRDNKPTIYYALNFLQLSRMYKKNE